MTGVALEYQLDIELAERALRGLSRLNIEAMAYNVGALLESSVKRRMSDEKQSPDGEPWALRSPAYAQTRRPGQSILISEGNLLDSIQNYSSGDEARVGTNLVYGAPHQFGSDKQNIPARPYLGLSDRDEDDIYRLVTGEIEELMQ